MSYTVHFITDSWEYRNLCLQTAFLPSDHTGDNLAEALTTLESWSLKEEQQICITTDSGASQQKAISRADVFFLSEKSTTNA